MFTWRALKNYCSRGNRESIFLPGIKNLTIAFHKLYSFWFVSTNCKCSPKRDFKTVPNYWMRTTKQVKNNSACQFCPWNLLCRQNKGGWTLAGILRRELFNSNWCSKVVKRASWRKNIHFYNINLNLRTAE